MIDGDFDEDESVRLVPIPDCFICPLTATVMEDPVMTVDGCTYERRYIERWIRQRQQEKLPVTSPATNQELPSLRIVSLTALRKAIEVYLAHRPELRDAHLASRSFEEAAQMLYGDLLAKQAVHASAEDELSLLKDSNDVLLRAMQEAEKQSAEFRHELECSKQRANAACEALRQEQSTNDTLRARLQTLESMLPASHVQSPASALEEPQRPAAPMQHISDLECSGFNSAASHASEMHAPVDKSAPSSSASIEKPASSTCSPDSMAGALVAPPGQRAAVALVSDVNSTAIVGSSSSASSPQARVWTRLAWLREGDDKSSRHIAFKLFGLFLFALLLVLVLLTRDVFREATVELAPHCGSIIRNVSLPSIAADVLTLEDEKRKRMILDDGMRDAIGQGNLKILKQVENMKTGSLEERTHAALVIGIAAATSPDIQAAVVHAGAVEPLVELLHADAPEARGQAAVALRTLALDNAYNKVVIERAGAIPVLMQLLRDDSLEVQEVAGVALQVLVESESQANSRQLIEHLMVESAEADAIDSLAALLNDETPGVREEAAGALMILAMDTDNQARGQAAALLQTFAAESAELQAASGIAQFQEDSARLQYVTQPH